MKNLMRTQSKNHLIGILAIVLLSIISSCAVFEPETKVTEETKFYAINRNTILDELSHDPAEIFTPQDRSPFETSPTLGPPVQWTETDYFHIAGALHELIWRESLATWKLHVIDYTIDCAYLDNGPQYAYLKYFKIAQIRNQDSSLLISTLIIEPRRNSVIGGKTEYYPYRNPRQEIDLAQLKISAEDALQIAEKAGGKAIRTRVANECDVSIILNPDSFYYEGWQVDYSPNTSDDLLASYYIDPITGELGEEK